MAIHKAEPLVGGPQSSATHCKVCGQRIRLVPGGHGSTWVHADSGAVAAPNPPSPEKVRLEELRQILRSESISQGELIELQGLAKYIEVGDVELLEAAGVPEHPEDVQSEWTTEELQAHFEVKGFAMGYVVVRRKSDGQLGSLQFDHAPRRYYGWVADQ